jgi:hypothetical protein
MNTLEVLQGYKKLSVLTIKKNIEKIEDLIDSSIIHICKKVYKDKYFYVLKYIIKNKILTLDDFLKVCKSEVDDNKYKIFDNITFRHDVKDANYNRGHSFRGKRRPDHSKKLKGRPNLKNKKDNWTDKRKSYDKEFNTTDWKRLVLSNKGYFLDGVSNENVDKIYSQFRRKIVNSDEYKLSKIQNFWNKEAYKKYYDKDILKNLTDSNLDEAYKIINSIIGTYHSIMGSNSMGNPIFKRTEFNNADFKKCLNTEPFITRSSLESEFIEKIIKPNENILESWSYENVTICIGSKLYTPDFIINIDNEEYLIELKGYIRDESNFEKIQDCVMFSAKYHNYIFLTNIEGLSIKDFKKMKEMEIYQKTHEMENIEPNKGISIGLTRNEIIKNLPTKSYFISNGLFFYTVEPDWGEVMFYLIINDKCIAEIKYNINESRIIEENSNSSRFSQKLKENLETHLDQFEFIKIKNKVETC